MADASPDRGQTSRAREIVRRLTQQGLTLATAESCTGGMIAAAITDIAGASAMFECGYVTYSNRAKAQMLRVSTALIEAHGAVSPQVARAMAEGARSRSGADLAISVTGIAGPGGSEFKPEGRVCFGLAGPHGTYVETLDFGAIGRSNVRHQTVQHALKLVLNHGQAGPQP